MGHDDERGGLIMPQPSSEISSFRPHRKFFGYDRKATDEFLKRVATLVEQAQTRLDQGESELAGYREKERSINEVLLSMAKVADSIKHDARLEEETIRRQARNLEEILTTTRSQLGSFLRETLERLEQLPEEIDSSNERESLGTEAFDASDLADHLASPVVRAVAQARGDEESAEGRAPALEDVSDGAATAHAPEQ
jgi:hypothetical protein